MADESENLVLVPLLEMRGELREIRAALKDHDKRFDVFDRRLHAVERHGVE